MRAIKVVSFTMNNGVTLQLPLSISLRDDASFENFYASINKGVISQIEKSVIADNSEGSIYLWGAESVGKTHLLEAACQRAAKLNLSAAYVPLKYSQDFKTSILDNLETCQLICIDDVDTIAGQDVWEQALFYLYNRAYERGVQMIFSATQNVKDSNIALADLVSRLSWGFVFHIQTLSDEDKAAALQLRAHLRGFDLPDKVVNYVLRRFPRDMNALFGLLDELDKASLTAKRKLTVPIVKQWFDDKENHAHPQN